MNNSQCQCHVHGSMLHTPPTNRHHVAATQERRTHTKSYLLTKNIEEISERSGGRGGEGRGGQENRPLEGEREKKDKTERATGADRITVTSKSVCSHSNYVFGPIVLRQCLENDWVTVHNTTSTADPVCLSTLQRRDSRGYSFSHTARAGMRVEILDRLRWRLTKHSWLGSTRFPTTKCIHRTTNTHRTSATFCTTPLCHRA